MFGNRSGHAHGTTGATHGTTAEPRARGGIAFGPILTGVVVAFGCMFLLSAIVGGTLAALGLLTDGLYAFLGGTAGDWLKRKNASSSFRRGRRYASGGVYLALGAAAAASGSGKD